MVNEEGNQSTIYPILNRLILDKSLDTTVNNNKNKIK